MSLPADLRRPLRATALRIRVQRAMQAGTILALAGLGLAAVILTLVKTGALPEGLAAPWLIAAAVLPLGGIMFGALRPIAPLLPAKLLDRAHGLADRTTNAVSFSALAERTPFEAAAIEDASAHATKLRAKLAMPLAVPPDVIGVLALGAAVAFLASLEVPRVIERRTVVGGGIVPVTLHEDDLEAFDSGLRDLIDDPRTPDDVRAAAQDFNRLVEDLADERLDRAESLRRIAELEEQLAQQVNPADAEQLRESLEQLGEAMQRSELAEALSEAMREGDAERAEAEMRALAERMRQEEPNRAEIERLRQALARAAQAQRPDWMAEIARMEGELAELRQSGGNARTIERRETEIAARRAECDEQQRQDRQEELQRLLQRQREQNQQTPEEQSLLRRRERELERLRRESQQQQEQRRQLDRLQRQMERSAQELNRDQQEQSAEQMDQGAEELNRMAQQQMSQEEMQRMQQQLDELRELIRRQREQRQQAGQNGQQQQRGQQGQGQRMDRFVLRARGQGDGEGIGIQRPGQSGQQGQQQGQGQGQGGQGQEGEQQQMLTLGGEGGQAMLEIPGMGGQAQQGGQSGQGRAQLGPGAGEGHDETTLDDPSLLGGDRQTVRVEGQQGDGPVRSDVEIYTGAQRGFTSRGYRDVHTRYEGHAEEVLERDQVPPGYRFYVRRYFQLIRPREQ
jgi:hypothetical protein